MISRLHYITPDITGEPLFDLVEKVCAAGVDWVQLRLKNKDDGEVLENAQEVRDICGDYDTRLVLNDYVHLAKECEAHGVHIGKQDMPVKEARNLLGPEMIIGGTANTLEDIVVHSEQSADYIGLGPIRFTTTKKVLSPILQEQDIANIMAQRYEFPPIIAIGGITPNDIRPLMGKGFHGIAVSSAISEADSVKAVAQYFIKKIEENKEVEI